METKTNIAELLKDCPRGMELYSPMFGKIYLEGVKDTGHAILIEVSTSCNSIHQFYHDGKYNTYYSESECLLFPSKDQRDWSKFQRPFKDGEVLSYQYNGYKNRTIYIYMQHSEMNTTYYVALSGNDKSEFMVNHKEGYALNSYNKSVRLATEEEKQKLFKAIKDNGYKWNAKTKTLEKLIEFNDGDILATDLGSVFFLNTRLNTDERYGCYVGKGGDGSFHICEPFAYKECCGLATKKEKQKLFDAIKANGYRWNAETKTLEKIEIESRCTYKEFIHYLADKAIGDKREVIKAFDNNEHNRFIGYLQVTKRLINSKLFILFKVDGRELEAEWQASKNYGVWQERGWGGESYSGYLLFPTYKDNEYFVLWYKC